MALGKFACGAGPPPILPGMTDVEVVMADLWATSITPANTRSKKSAQLTAAGILTAEQLRDAEDGTRVRAAGQVTGLPIRSWRAVTMNVNVGGMQRILAAARVAGQSTVADAVMPRGAVGHPTEGPR
jgi:hypothetical protein